MLGGREPQATDADRLPWTTAVITETMRLYPPAWTIERDAVTADDMAGVRCGGQHGCDPADLCTATPSSGPTRRL